MRKFNSDEQKTVLYVSEEPTADWSGGQCIYNVGAIPERGWGRGRGRGQTRTPAAAARGLAETVDPGAGSRGGGEGEGGGGGALLQIREEKLDTEIDQNFTSCCPE